MYTFVRAMLRKKGSNHRYESVDLSRLRMSEIYSTYADGFVELSNPALTKNTFTRLQDLFNSDRYVYTNGYFPDWLTSQGNHTIYGSTVEPAIVTEKIRFSDAVQAGFNLRRTHPSDIAGENTYPRDMLTDIYLHKPLGTEIALKDYVLGTVNGFAHLMIPKGDGILLKGGGTTAETLGDAHVGIISFEKMCSIDYLVFNDDNIVPDDVYPLSKGVYIKTGIDLSGKTPILSLAGRLLLDHSFITVINRSIGLIRLNLQYIDFMGLVLGSIGYIDTKTLNLDVRTYKNGSLLKEDTEDDETVRAILKLLQSFLVILDQPNVIFDTETLTTPRMPGFYESFTPRNLPYVDDRGLLHAYWKIKHTGVFNTVHRFHLKDTFYNQPMRETGGDYGKGVWLNNNYDFIPRTTYNIGRLAYIGFENMVFEE